MDAPQAVIGSGTSASCLTNAARNAFSAAVTAGGSITFNCGAAPLVMPVDTSVATTAVVIDGAGLISLSGENLRQIFLVQGAGDLTLKNIILTNGASFAGPAIAIYGAAAKATFINGFIIGNNAGSSNGGAIFNQGTLTILNSSIGANLTTGFGGAIFNNQGTVVIKDTTIINNHASDGAGIYHAEGSLTIENSAIRSNIAANQGGGIHIDTGSASVTNTTLYDNKALQGGGIFMRGNTLDLVNDTFNLNRANTGGALWKDVASTIRIQNSILANSKFSNDTPGSLECDGPSATSLGRNIIEDGTCLPNPGSSGDLFNTDPKLDAFIRDNGGHTRTFMPLSDSPAINYALNCPPRDQRGIPRPLGSACDTGSVEVGTEINIPYIRLKN
jgi:hypothetical protein